MSIIDNSGKYGCLGDFLSINVYQNGNDLSGRQKLSDRLVEPGLFGSLNLHDNAVLHDRQDGPIPEPLQGVSNPGQGGIVRRCSGLGRGDGIGAMPLTVGWFVAHVMLGALLGIGEEDR
jgi:hypothetical protein